MNFRGEKRGSATHESVVDPEARLYKKSHGVAAKLSHGAHVLMENRNGLVIDVSVTEANGFAEREAALEMLTRARERHELEPLTLGADKGYAAGAFLVALEEEQGIVPLIPMPAIPIKGSSKGARARRRARRRRTSKQFKLAQKVRKRVEEIIGWDKVVGGMRRSRHVGRWKITQQVLLVNSAYNLIRMARLGAQAV